MLDDNEEGDDEEKSSSRRVAEKHLGELEACLAKSVASFETDASGFCERGGIFQMGAFIRIYAELMKALGAIVREDVNDQLDEPVCNRLETFFNNWDQFLDRVESQDVNREHPCSSCSLAGDEVPKHVNEEDFKQISLDEEKFDLLNRRVDEFKRAGCQVVMVSFGEARGASRWLAENFPASASAAAAAASQLDLIVDSNRTLYRLIGVRRSFQKVWSSECLTYYAEQVAAGRELPKAYKDVHDDPHQMGGNFMLEFHPDGLQRFKMVYVYKSKTPNDRPTCDQMLNFLKTQ